MNTNSHAPRKIRHLLLAGGLVAGTTLLSIGPAAAAEKASEPGRAAKVTLPTSNAAKSRPSSSGGGLPTTIVLVAAGLAACGAAAGGVVIGRKSIASAPAAGPGSGSSGAPVPASVAGYDHGTERAEAAARTLARTLIDLRDRVTSDAIKAEIGAALEQADVHEHIVPPGTPFDPRVHVGIDTTPVGDAAWDQRVATTERPGYFTGNTVLRQPAVVVCRFRPATPGEH